MAITVNEAVSQRKANIKEAERHYVILGATDEVTAYNALYAAVPVIIGGLPINIPSITVEETFTNVYAGEAKWSFKDKDSGQDANKFSVSFDVGGQTTHITQSKSTVNTYLAAGAKKFDYKGAINVQEDGTVDGCDIIVPAITFQIDYTVLPSLITESYTAMLALVCGRTNNATYKGFAAGELLLNKVSGQRRDRDNWDISFGFLVSKNRTDLMVGTIGPISKKGWEYMWARYARQQLKDPTTEKVIGTCKQPVQVYIEKVYDDTDYSVLNIPAGYGII